MIVAVKGCQLSWDVLVCHAMLLHYFIVFFFVLKVYTLKYSFWSLLQKKLLFLDSIYITNVSELYHTRYTLYNEPAPQDQSLSRGSIKLTSRDQSLIERSIKTQTYVTRLFHKSKFSTVTYGHNYTLI
jgi:hypothetical protein